MEAGRIFIAATGGNPDAARGGGYEATGQKVAEQFPGAAAPPHFQHYIRQLQGIASQLFITSITLKKVMLNFKMLK